MANSILTAQQIFTRVTKQFGDTVGSQIGLEDVIRWINDAQRELAVNNNLLQVRATTPLVAGQFDYVLPSDILTVHSVKFNGQKVLGVSLQESDELINSNNIPTGAPSHYWMWSGIITVFPTPDTATAALSTLKMYYTREPLELSVSTDTPELPPQYHNRIVEYCLAQAYELDDNMQGAQMKMGQFKQGSDMLKDNESWQQRDVYPSITVVADDTMAEGYYYAQQW